MAALVTRTHPEEIMLSLTAAPRSSVVHVISNGPEIGSASFTACGRRIGDNWQGEYGPSPTGPVTCKRCAVKEEAHYASIAQRAAFKPDQRVGIITGVQTANPHVGSYGTVVRAEELWTGQIDYVVRTDDGEEGVYARHLQSDDVSGDRVTIRQEASAAGIPLASDGLPVVGHPVWQHYSGITLDAVRDYAERQAAMDRHPAGKSLPAHAPEIIDGWQVRRHHYMAPITRVIMGTREIKYLGRQYVIALYFDGADTFTAQYVTCSMGKADSVFRDTVEGLS